MVSNRVINLFLLKLNSSNNLKSSNLNLTHRMFLLFHILSFSIYILTVNCYESSSSSSLLSHHHPISTERKNQLLQKFKISILNELGITTDEGTDFESNRIVREAPKIDMEEYKRAYGEYLENVKRRKLEERGGRRLDDRKKSSIVFQRVNPGTIESRKDSNSGIELVFNIEEPSSSELKIKKRSLKLPPHCVDEEGRSGEVDVSSKPHSSSLIFTVFCPSNLYKSQDFELFTSYRRGGRGRRSVPPSSLQNYEPEFQKLKNGRDCESTRHGKTCCRKSMRINFSEINITDIILEPKEFESYMCSGRCNAKRVPFATTHAMLQHALHQTKNHNHVPRPCCTPTKLKHLDVLHTVPGKNLLKVTILTNAIVKECSCS